MTEAGRKIGTPDTVDASLLPTVQAWLRVQWPELVDARARLDETRSHLDEAVRVLDAREREIAVLEREIAVLRGEVQSLRLESVDLIERLAKVDLERNAWHQRYERLASRWSISLVLRAGKAFRRR